RRGPRRAVGPGRRLRGGRPRRPRAPPPPLHGPRGLAPRAHRRRLSARRAGGTRGGARHPRPRRSPHMDRAGTDLAAGAEDGTDAGAADDEDRGAVPRAGDDAGAGGAGAAAGGDDTAAGADDEDVAPAPSGLSWPKVAVLGLALAFLGFAVGIFVSRDRPPGPDSADVGFLQDMLTHHDQALGVATLTVAYG